MSGTWLDWWPRLWPWAAEDTLQDGERTLAALFEAVPDAIVVVDRSGRILRANDEADRMFAYGADELRGQSIDVLVPERHRTAHQAHRSSFSRDPSRRKMGDGRRLFARRKDGTEFPVDISLMPIGDGAARVVMAVVRDLTERREAQRRFRRLLESAPDAMLLTSRSGHVVAANARADRLFGYEPRELTGLHVELLVPEPARARHRLGFAAFWEQPRVQHLGGSGTEIRGLRKDGGTFPVEIDLGPLETDVGLLAVTSIRDLTERRRAEREREDLLAQLRRGREHLRILSTRLLEVQEAERRAIAHELHDEIGQSLTAVSLDLQALAARSDPSNRPLVESALELTRQVMAQVRELSLDLRPSLLDDLGLTAAIRWSLERHEQRLGWATTLSENLGHARLAPPIETTCFRVAQEALTNVAKHAAARTVRVEIRRLERELVLVVEDDGRGFDVEERRARAASGDSIGLLGMEERATSVGGRLVVESRPGTGTTLQAWFPVTA